MSLAAGSFRDSTRVAGSPPELVRAMTEALQRWRDAEHIRVIVREVPRAHWATGDLTLSEMDAATPPSAPSTPTVSQEPT